MAMFVWEAIMHGTLLAYDYPLLGAFWTVMWVFLAILWIFLLVRVVVDVFRDDSLGGVTKTAWLLFVVFLPFLGVFAYVVARGARMGEREERHAAAQQRAFESYIRKTAGTSRADELARLGELRAHGDITEEEFRRAKEKVLS